MTNLTQVQSSYKGLTHPDRFYVEELEQWEYANKFVPFLSFPSDWKVKIIAPTGRAFIRFIVKTPHCDWVSVYLDTTASLGSVRDNEGKSIPYWEVYPVNGSNKRCHLHETDRLFDLIASARPCLL